MSDRLVVVLDDDRHAVHRRRPDARTAGSADRDRRRPSSASGFVRTIGVERRALLVVRVDAREILLDERAAGQQEPSRNAAWTRAIVVSSSANRAGAPGRRREEDLALSGERRERGDEGERRAEADASAVVYDRRHARALARSRRARRDTRRLIWSAKASAERHHSGCFFGGFLSRLFSRFLQRGRSACGGSRGAG